MEENLSLGFPTRSHINWPVQPQKMARSLKFWIKKTNFTICVVKTKALISFAFTAMLICAGGRLVFIMTRRIC